MRSDESMNPVDETNFHIENSIVLRISIMNPFTKLSSRTIGTNSTGKNVGFIGVGNMGSGMAMNLLKKRFKVTVFDKAGETPNVIDLREAGASVTTTLDELVVKNDVLISMVPSTKHVQELYLSPSGILSSLNSSKKSLFLDCSTIDPLASRVIGDACRLKGHSFIDAPVSGGVLGARAGTLTFMVGAGSDSEFSLVEPVLSAMGKPINCGGWGKGAAVKICNNLILAASMLGVAEGYALAQKLGVDLGTFDKIVNSSTGKCWSSEQYNPVPGLREGIPSSNEYKGGFAIDLMVKDLGLAIDVAGDKGSVAQFCENEYSKVGNLGFGHLDFSSVFKYLN